MATSDPFGWVGATLSGKFRIDAVVGEGGFGVVYRGHHLGFDEPVAVKCLRVPATMAGADREAFHATFLEEGKLLHRLSRATAGIVQALDVGAAESPSGAWTPYLVLEWLRGAPLDRDLAERRKSGAGGRGLADAIALLAPAARALEVAHAQGVAHRDVKPANLFVSEIGDKSTLKVLDFGIAKVLSEVVSVTAALAETGRSVKAFTPQYGAPEQFHRRFGATGPWTDVFALALVLIEVASGKIALDGDDSTQLFIASTDPSFRPSLQAAGVDAPAAVAAVIARAVAVDPRERYRTAGEFWNALEAAMPGATTDVKRTGDPAVAPTLPEELASMSTGEYLAIQDTASAPKKPADSAPAATPPARSDPAIPPTREHALPAESPSRDVIPAAIEPAAPRARSRGRGPVLVLAGAAALTFGAGALFLRRPPPAPIAPPKTVESAPPPASPIPPGMVRIPAGRFTMGNANGGRTEKPPHDVTITRAFDLDRTEVTVEAYQRCIESKRCTPSGVHGPKVEESDIEKRGPLCTAKDPAKARHPITCVDQAQAAAYCAFMGKRLPTEAEWEYAARGADAREYPWGNDGPNCEQAVVARGPHTCTRPRGTIEVGSLVAGASPFGALDMAGNAWEWVADGWDSTVYSKGPQTDPLVPATGEKGVLRGGSWDYAPSSAKTTFRLSFDRGAGDAATGFRCARTVD